jgi:carbonic anhydrase
VQDVYAAHRPLVDAVDDENDRLNRLCALNVLDQARHVCETTVVQEAWARGQELAIHAWIYGLTDGLISDLGFVAQSEETVTASYGAALARLTPRA